MLRSSLSRYQCVDEITQKAITEDRRDKLMLMGYVHKDDRKRMAQLGYVNAKDARLSWDESAYIGADQDRGCICRRDS